MQRHWTAQPRVLLVDDELSVLEQLTEVLRGAGLACEGCASADAALPRARQLMPDLIVADTNLAGYSGVELCEQIRTDPALADVPVMFLSAGQVPDIIRRPHPLGGAYYVRKPFSPEVLLELIERVLWMPSLVEGHRVLEPAQ